jgi:hypothetical protein
MSFGQHFNERKYNDLKNRITELEKKFNALEAKTEKLTEVLNIPVVSNNEVAVNCRNCKHLNNYEKNTPCNICFDLSKFEAIN